MSWETNDENVGRFFDRLQEAIPGAKRAHLWEDPSDTELAFDNFRAHCEQRERAGREQFGERYLSRDNPLDALEEYADGAIYPYLDTLQSRLTNRAAEIDLVLTAASYAFRAHEAIQRLIAKRRGSP